MVSKRRVFAGLVLLCVVSPGTRANAQAVSDSVNVVLNAVPTLPGTFVGITPCRLVDTRTGSGFSGAFGPPSLVGQPPGGTSRLFPVAGNCGIPATAQVVSANMAVTNTSGTGFISVWPGGDPQPTPLVASLNFSAGQTIANAVIVPLGSGGIQVFARVTTDLVIDVNGYFDTSGSPAHEVGAPGEPGFFANPYCIWSHYQTFGPHATVGFYKDASGLVHLKGMAKATDGAGAGGCVPGLSDGQIFTLPVGYRPAQRSVFVSITNEQLGRVNIEIDGQVRVGENTPNITANMKVWISLEGVSFKATQ